MTDEKKTSSRDRIAKVRAQVAHVLWLICLVCALLLIGGALLIALKANRDNSLVMFVIDTADKIDLGVFDRNNGVLKFEEGSRRSRELKNALVNWGLAGIVWMIVGRISARLVRG